jgi:hypothetical protein
MYTTLISSLGIIRTFKIIVQIPDIAFVNVHNINMYVKTFQLAVASVQVVYHFPEFVLFSSDTALWYLSVASVAKIEHEHTIM